MQLKQVQYIMESVRDWCTANRHNLNHKGFSADLNGMCAIASGMLFEQLTMRGYKPIIAMSEGEYDSAHCFVLLEDMILDVTASQFGEPDIVIAHEKSVDMWYWTPRIQFGMVRSLLKHQKRTGWPKHQLVVL